MAIIDPQIKKQIIEAVNNGSITMEMAKELKAMENQERADSLIEKMKARGFIKGIEAPSEESKAEYTPKPVQYDHNKPEELAMAISQRDNIPYGEALQTVMYAPRGSKARMKEGANQYFQPMADLTDIWDLTTTRLPQGINELYKEYKGEPSDFVGEMTRTQAPASEGFVGGVGEFGENLTRDPIPFVSGGLGGLVGGLPKVAQFMASTPKLVQGGLAGLGYGGGELLAEQERRRELDQPLMGATEVGANLLTGGVLSAGGAKVGDIIKNKIASKGMTTPRQEVKAVQKELQTIADDAIPQGVAPEKWNKITPMNRFAFNPANKGGKGEIPYTDLLKIGRASAEGVDGAINPLEHTFREVGLPAFKEYESILNKVGSDLGEIREEFGSKIAPINKDALLESFSEGTQKLGKYNLKSVDLRKSINKDGKEILEAVSSDGNVIGGKTGRELVEALEESEGSLIRAFDKDGDIVRKKILNPKVTDLIETLEEFPNELTGNKLEMLREKVNSLVDKDLVSSQPLKSKENSLVQGIAKSLRTNIDDGIEKLDPNIVEEFQALRSEYGQIKNNRDILGGLIGATIKGADGTETTKKGTSALKRVVQSLQDQGSKVVWEDVKKRTGYDVRRASGRALEAMVENGDNKAKGLLEEMGLLNQTMTNIASGGGKLDKAKKAYQMGKDYIDPSAIPSLQVERQIKNAQKGRGMLDLVEQNPYMNFASSFAPYGQAMTRDVTQQGLEGLGGN